MQLVLPAALVAAIAFWPSLGFGFTLDDRRSCRANHDVTDPNVQWQNVFTNDYWGTPLADKQSHISFRPLTTLSLRMDRWRGGGSVDASGWLVETSAAPFHVTNVLLHAAASAAVALLAHQVRAEAGGSPAPSVFAGVLFAAHPVHTENVANITGRADVLATIFLCMYLGLLHRAAAGQVSSVTGAAGRLIAATALGVAAGLSKETAAPLLLVPVAWQAWTWTWSVDADDEQ